MPGYRRGMKPELTHDEIDARSRLGRFIPMASLPGDRDDLLAGATDLNAPDDVLAELERLPEDELFETVSEVWAALGHRNEDATRR